MAAVEATDCAIDGTVSWASRDEGRPALAGVAAATAAADDADDGTALAGVEGADMGIFSFATTAGAADLACALTTGFATELTGDESLATVLPATLTVALLAGLDTGGADFTGIALAAVLLAVLLLGLAATLAAGLGTVLGVGLVVALDSAFTAGLAAGLTGLAIVFVALGADFTAGLLATAGLLFAAALVACALVSFPDLAFTSCLLAEVSCARLAAVSPARECTGLALDKPISCKIETII